MSHLIKISEVSLKYDISTRALRYYEEAGLIESIRTPDHTYRLYDEKAIKTLEQILVLRKLDIPIKDIQRIFSCNELDVLIEVLKQKLDGINEEASLLQQLKEMVLVFIDQLENVEGRLETHIKHLYDQVNTIQAQTDHQVKVVSSTVKQLAEVTEKLEKMPDIKIVKLPRVKMARSGNTDLDIFDKWWSAIDIEQTLFPRDFMWFNPRINAFEWLFTIPENLVDTNGYEVFEFPGGLYAVATALDEGEEIGRINKCIHKWVNESCDYEYDNGNSFEERYDMGHVVTPPEASIRQMDLFIPIVKKGAQVVERALLD